MVEEVLKFIFVGIEFFVIDHLSFHESVVFFVAAGLVRFIVGVVGRVITIDNFLIGLSFHVEELSFV